MGDGDGQEDCGGVHGSGRRLCRRAYGQGRRGRDLYRFLARARRAHETAWADDHPSARCRAVYGAGPGPARHRVAADQQGKAVRHRLCLHQVLRHGLGDGHDQAVSRARWLCRLAAELHERGDDRGRRRLGQDLGLDCQLDHRRVARARSDQARRRQVRLETHRLPGRRSAWPRHRPRQGGLRPPRQRRQRLRDREYLGRALVEAGHQRDGQWAFGLHRPDRPGSRQERRAAAFLEPARQRGDPGRPGARLYL